MRKEFADYHFYKISCIDDDIELSYIGSTSNWKQRNRRHKDACNNKNNSEYNQKKYQMIRENGGWNNFKMVEIGFKENLTLTESRQIEEEYRVDHRAKLNQCKCFQTKEDKKEYKKEYNKKYNEKIKEKNSEKITCECGAVVSQKCLSRHKRSKKHLSICIPVEPS